MTTPHPMVKVGGLFHQPDYLAAYHEAARVLMQTGRTKELAMPILYLQRHTVELLLKELRDGAHGAIEATQEIQKAKGQPVMAFSVPTPKKQHGLGSLLTDAEAALSALGWTVPVSGLRELVALCESVEQGDETRAAELPGRHRGRADRASDSRNSRPPFKDRRGGADREALRRSDEGRQHLFLYLVASSDEPATRSGALRARDTASRTDGSFRPLTRAASGKSVFSE